MELDYINIIHIDIYVKEVNHDITLFILEFLYMEISNKNISLDITNVQRYCETLDQTLDQIYLNHSIYLFINK